MYMRKPEIPVGKSNGSCNSVWEALKNMVYSLRQCNFFESVQLTADRSPTKSNFILFVHEISTQVVCLSGNHPWTPDTARQLWATEL